MRNMAKSDSLEAQSKKRLRRGIVQDAVIGSIALAGTLAIAMAAPNTLKLIKHVDTTFLQRGDPRRRVQVTISKLKRKGLIAFVERNGKTSLELTAAGKSMAAQIRLKQLTIARPRRWDGRWRVIVFDIPEARRADRQRVRQMLLGLGFARLQDSVWAHPYPCEEVIVVLKTELRLGRHLLYMIVDAIDYDKPLKVYFDM